MDVGHKHRKRCVIQRKCTTILPEERGFVCVMLLCTQSSTLSLLNAVNDWYNISHLQVVVLSPFLSHFNSVYRRTCLSICAYEKSLRVYIR